MLRQITWSQFKDWIAYSEIDPFFEERADFRDAQICATIANVNRRRGSQPYKPSDFMPKFERTVQTWQEQKALAMLYAEAFNKDVG
jgi:hypothetical protein